MDNPLEPVDSAAPRVRPVDFTEQDKSHLNLLAMFWYVKGVLSLITSFGMLLYFGFMQYMMMSISAEAGDIPELDGIYTIKWMMLGLGGGMVLFGLLGCCLPAIPRWCLQKRRG